MKSNHVCAAAGMATLLLAFSCSKEPVATPPLSEGERTIHMTVEAAMPEVVSDDQTKVVLDEFGQPKWEGNEKVGVMVAENTASKTKYYSDKVSSLSSIAKGVFSGNVTIPNGYKIIGVGYPAELSQGKTHVSSGAVSHRLVMTIPNEQTQEAEGIFNSNNFPLYFVTEGIQAGDNVISEKTFNWACCIFYFSVYGKNDGMGVGEKIKSIRITTDSWATGYFEWVSETSYQHNANNSPNTTTLTLDEACDVSNRTSVDEGAKLYMAVLPKRAELNIQKVTVTTDAGASYSKSLTKTYSMLKKQGHVYKIGINMAKLDKDE